jgi:TP901 family phage tail tape measure protein
MADAQKTIELIFQGVDKTGAATQSALENAQKFSGSIKDITEPIANFTMGALKLEAGLLTAGAAIVAFSVKSASDFDSAFRQISTIIDASDEDLLKFKNSILSYASTSTMPLEQITNALGAAIGSGVDWAQSLDLISTAEKLAVATRSDLDGTTKVLVSTLNSYGLSIADAGKVSDLFFKIIDEGDIGMADLANSFAKVAPIAKISGVSLEEVGAAIATLTASGIKPAESIEYLRGAISNIISPSKQGADLAAELGIQFNAAGLKANGLAGLLQQVAEKTGGSADKMKLLFGDIGGFTAAATLAGPQAQKFAETLQAMGNVAGATDEAFKKITGSLDVAGAKIASAFNSMTEAIGQPLLDEFGGIANAIAAIFQALGASVKDGALGELVKYIEQNLQGLQRTIETVAKNLPAALAQADFGGFQRGIDSVVNAVKLLFSNIDLSTVDGLTRAIEVAGAAFLGLSKFTAGVIESFKPLFDALVEIGQGLREVDSSIFETLGSFAGFITQLDLVLPALTAFLGLLTVKEGIGLIGALRATSVAAGGTGLAGSIISLASASGPILPILAAMAAGVFAVRDATEELRRAQGHQKEAQETQNRLIEVTADVIRYWSERTGVAIRNQEHFNELIENGTLVWDDATEGWKKAGEATKELGGYFSTVTGKWVDLTASAKESNAAWGQSRVALELQAAAQKNAAVAADAAKPIFDALTGKVVGYEKASNSAATSTDKTATALSRQATEAEKASKEAAKLTLELEKIYSNERVKAMELKVKLDMAQLEADTKKFETIFKSIDNTVTQTTQSITKLFDTYANGASTLTFSQLQKIEDQIAKENKVRDDQLGIQKELTKAQIEEIRARTESLKKGNALIKIDGAGLQPHLEAFMFEVLRALQVKVNADGLEMLLGGAVTKS